MANYLKRLSWN